MSFCLACLASPVRTLEDQFAYLGSNAALRLEAAVEARLAVHTSNITLLFADALVRAAAAASSNVGQYAHDS